MQRRKILFGFLANGTLVICSLAVALLLSEFMLRWIFHDLTTTADNQSFFSARWQAQHVHINQAGFREREFEPAPPQGQYRIAVIGDSFAYGQGIDRDERFSALLERALNRGEALRSFEVLNFGRAGAETIDHIEILRRHVLSIDPDFVLLQWYVNDFEGHDKSRRPRPLPLWPHWTHHRLLQSSALYYMVNRQWTVMQYQLGWVRDHFAYMRERFGNPDGDDSRQVVELLRQFMTQCRSRQIGVGLVLFPFMDKRRYATYPYDYLHERVLAVCRQVGVPAVDLRAAYATYPDQKALRINRFDAHPSATANQIAAAEMMKTFGLLWHQDRIARKAAPYHHRF